VATFSDNGAPGLNGNSTTTTVASPTIHAKNVSGRGVLSSSKWATPVARSAATAATRTIPVVCASP
jgi:hypothetical protein